MAVTFNPGALNMFREAQLPNENSIANLDGRGGIKANGKLGSFLWKPFRTGETRANNNAVRTELLKSLGNAFGLEGVGMNEQGKVTFSKDFMDRLEKLLGRNVLKTGDFEIAADGTVSSGKPLTQRRISAIVKQAQLVSHGEYDYKTYKTKLAYVQEALAKLPGGDAKAVGHFAKVAKLMDFVEHEVDTLVDQNPDYDPEYATVDNDPIFSAKYILNTRDEKGRPQKVPLNKISQVSIHMNTQIGEIFHIEENILGSGRFSAKYEDLTDPKAQLNGYLKRTATSFITTSIDQFIASEKAGKLPDYLATLNYSWPCIEGKTSGLIEFGLHNLPMDDSAPVATHDKDQPLDQCIGREIAAIVQQNPDVEKWEDVAAQVKKNLVGVVRPMSVLEKGSFTDENGNIIETRKFKTQIGQTGKPVVRAITENDLDAIGQDVMDTILYG